MGTELRPLGVSCNIACSYCYQNPQREAGNVAQSYDLQRMKAAVEREGGPFTLFGGEPLLVPLPDLEDLFRWGQEKYGGSSIQTNGALISDAHIRLFKNYNVDVGVSVDGPGELNDLRRQGNLENTRRLTVATQANIERLCREHHPPGLIVTLHRVNASPDRLPRLIQWARDLDALGVRSIRLHLLETESEAIRRAFGLSDEENVAALHAFAKLQGEMKNLRFDVLDEMEHSLLGEDHVTSCVWRGCDPYTTEAVTGIEGNGQSSNCGRTNKDGVDFLKAGRPGYERYLALYYTPQDHGGCMGCRFFLMCKGQCPGTAIGGDWRNRSELCGVWKSVFTQLEANLLSTGRTPLSVHPVRGQLERQMIRHWMDSSNSLIENLSLPDSKEESNLEAEPFPLPAFVREAYVGESQRQTWAPRLAAIRTALARVAVISVAKGCSRGARMEVAGSEVIEIHNIAAALDLHTTLLPPAGRLETRTMIVGEESGVMPECCRRACGRVLSSGDLLQPIGLSLLGYMPCSPECEPCRELAQARLQIGKENGMAEEMGWLEEILGWPIEWSALHGIAEIKTGIFKAAYATGYTPDKVTIRYRGKAPALNAARGLGFAYETSGGQI